jgi:4-amino-4-deoxy-L-arabinose transferase-like glycosyltransferase
MSFLTAINCVLTYATAKEVANQKVAVLAGLLAALYPNLFYWGALLSTEVLFTTLFLAAIYLIVKSKENPSINRLVLTGIFLGLAALARGTLLFFLPFFFIWVIYFYWGDKKTMLKTVVCVFAMVIITIAPWTIRNYVIFGKLVSIAINGGRSLYGGNNPASLNKGTIGLGLWDDTAMQKLLPETKQMSPFERDRYCYKKAVEWIIYTLKNKPLDFIKLELWKVQKAWFPRLWNRTSYSKVLFVLAYLFVGISGIIGLILSLQHARTYSLFYVALTTHLFIVLIFFGEMRFRAPFDPILIIFSALGLTAFYQWSSTCRN